MTRSNTDLILPAATSILVPLAAFMAMGPMPLAVFAFAFGGGFVVYWRTLWRVQIDARLIVVPYLLTVALFILHVGEEYFTDFETVASKIGGIEVPEANFMAIAAFGAPIMWVLGAILILTRRAFGDYFLCMFFFAMMLAELSHYVFPFVIDGTFHYESGMYTAALPLIPAAYGVLRMRGLVRAARAVT